MERFTPHETGCLTVLGGCALPAAVWGCGRAVTPYLAVEDMAFVAFVLSAIVGVAMFLGGLVWLALLGKADEDANREAKESTPDRVDDHQPTEEQSASESSIHQE